MVTIYKPKKSSYNTIYIPRYYRLNPSKTTTLPYKLLKKYLKNPSNTVENLYKAQAIFLDKVKLDNFIKFLSSNSSVRPKYKDKTVITDNVNYILGLFFQKKHPFYLINFKIFKR